MATAGPQPLMEPLSLRLSFSAFFFVDAFGEYFVNASYFFSVDLWIEATVSIVAAVTGAILSGLTYCIRFTNRRHTQPALN